MTESILTKMTADVASRAQMKRGVIIALFLSLLTNAVLALYLALKSDASRVVVIAPETSEPFVAMNEEVSPNLLERFSISAINAALNATPQTAAYQAETFLKFVAPESYATLASIMRRDAAELQRNQASSAFFPFAASVDTKKGTTCLTGEKKTMIGKAVTQTQNVNVCLQTVTRMGRLWITGISMSPVSAKTSGS